MLANGDRRDCFVVIDQAGGHHALNKKLTGLTLAKHAARLADLDRAQLPGVEQAKELQAQRQPRAKPHRRANTGRGADAPGQGTTPADGPERAADSPR